MSEETSIVRNVLEEKTVKNEENPVSGRFLEEKTVKNEENPAAGRFLEGKAVKNEKTADERNSLEMKKNAAEEITTSEFVAALCEAFLTQERRVELQFSYKQDTNALQKEFWIEGRKCGWLEEQDQLWAEQKIEKRSAARIIHEFLRIEYLIPDERVWGEAKKLEDLYHCRVCAKHVAQVYVKGLMKAQNVRRFGLLAKITEEEMLEIFENIRKYLQHNM